MRYGEIFHNMYAPIIVIKLDCFLQPFMEVNCRRLAYLSACGKYLQLLLRGAFWLTTYMTLVSDTISSLSCSLSKAKIIVVVYLIGVSTEF